jgi:hypothetical protein
MEYFENDLAEWWGKIMCNRAVNPGIYTPLIIFRTRHTS